ncbi:MAG: hypothetical protein CVV17_08055, partial [Gammaproteobacteria bacterium HGW-Gammaproteobacteria-7]
STTNGTASGTIVDDDVLNAPTAANVSATGLEDATSISIALSASDIDGTIASYTIGSLPANGTLYADAALTTPLAAGATVTSATLYFVPAANWNGSTSFNYSATDNEGLASNTATASFSVTPVNDPAIIGGQNRGSVIEDFNVTNGMIRTSGTLTVSDPDTGEAAFQPQSTPGAYGTFTINAAGSWTYQADNSNPAIQSMTVWESRTETFTVATVDGTTSTVTVEVNGTNDAPVNALPASFTTLEDTPLKLSGLSVTDIDVGTRAMTVSLAVSSGTLVAASAGGVTVTGSGTGSIVLSGTLAAINSYLATAASQPTYVPVADDSGNVTLTMTSNDGGFSGLGALTDTDSRTITITPVADAVPGSDVSLVIGTPLTNTINFGSNPTELIGKSAYTFPSGITISTGSSDTTFEWWSGSLLSVQTAGESGANRISGTE